jgi:hypothetical protein
VANHKISLRSQRVGNPCRLHGRGPCHPRTGFAWQQPLTPVEDRGRKGRW